MPLATADDVANFSFSLKEDIPFDIFLEQEAIRKAELDKLNEIRNDVSSSESKPQKLVKPQVLVRWGDFVKRDIWQSEGKLVLATQEDFDAGNQAKYYPVHQYQQRILESKSRFIGAIAGTGGGKTVTGPLWVLNKLPEIIANYGKCLGLVLAPTYKVLARATMPTFVDTFKGTAYEGTYIESKSKYILPNNWGIIWCQSTDNPGGIEGGQFDFAWFDEGGQGTNKAFNAIYGRLGLKQGQFLVTTTPYVSNEGFGPLHTEWWEEYSGGNKNYDVIQWASIENPAYPKEEFERAKATMPSEIFQSRYCGLFTGLEGRVYPNFERCFISLSESQILTLLDWPGKFFGGIDYGWNDPFCALLGKLLLKDYPEVDLRTGDIVLLFERYISKTTIEEHEKVLPKKGDVTWFSEHNPELIQKLRDKGHNVRRAPKLKKVNNIRALISGILTVNKWINSGKLKIPTNIAVATVWEGQHYIYPEKDNVIVGEDPIDKDNHGMDALRYLLTGADRYLR